MVIFTVFLDINRVLGGGSVNINEGGFDEINPTEVLNAIGIILGLIGAILGLSLVYCEYAREWRTIKITYIISFFGNLLFVIANGISISATLSDPNHVRYLFTTPVFYSIAPVSSIILTVFSIIMLITGIAYFLSKRSDVLGIEYGVKTDSSSRRGEVSEDTKYELFGIIRMHNKLDFAQASRILRIPSSDIKRMIYQLVGRGEITGQMEKKEFILESGVDDFLEKLDEAFSSWHETEETKVGKLNF